MREKLISELICSILAEKHDTPLLVGIDGIDASGKTRLATILADQLELEGYPIIRSSVDNFHHPREMRYQRGKYSPEGYYFDSFNYSGFISDLLEPLGPNGSRNYRTALFDHKTDQEISGSKLTAANDSILICDGVFLFRRELLPFWDVKIFLDITFDTSLQRALERDLPILGSEREIIKRYQERYIPGQRIYFDKEHPKEKADIIIDNNDHRCPTIIFKRTS